MNAMENASKNAGEILDKVTLDYNKARQSKITMELIEIISGASVWACLWLYIYIDMRWYHKMYFFLIFIN